MASKQAQADNTIDKKTRRKQRMKKAGIALLILLLIIVGFFLGIYLKIFDSEEMNKQFGLYDMPIIGEYFVRPAPDSGSTVPQEEEKKDTKTEKKEVKLTQAEVDKITQQRQTEEKKRVAKLARLYNEMKPKDAARILEAMDNDIVIAIMQKMDESQVAQILTEFDPDRAAGISRIMYVGAPKRVQQITANEQQGDVSFSQ